MKFIAFFSPCGGVGKSTMAAAYASHFKGSAIINLDGKPFLMDGIPQECIITHDVGVLESCHWSEDFSPVVAWLKSTASSYAGKGFERMVMDHSVDDLPLLKVLASDGLAESVIIPVSDDPITWSTTVSAVRELIPTGVRIAIVPVARDSYFDNGEIKKYMAPHGISISKNEFRLGEDNADILREIDDTI